MGIEFLTVSGKGEVASHGIVLNPLADGQLTIASPSSRKFINACLEAVPRQPLPVCEWELVLPDGTAVTVEEYCAQKGVHPLEFLANYRIGETEPRFSEPKIKKFESPGSRDFNAALAQYFNGVEVGGVNVYATLVFLQWQK